jgi:hypothetical protein
MDETEAIMMNIGQRVAKENELRENKLYDQANESKKEFNESLSQKDEEYSIKQEKEDEQS